ncbi:blue copper protein-like, partial [Morus notabilis]|uniref:blue copper protein-like n=1 Tax=Morus notabilis TaxID=981085 RepID=UPI000CED6B95
FILFCAVFNFANGSHDVAEVTKENYNSCNTNSTISLYTNPPVRITLDTAGEHFFTCTFTGHCDGGQKLSINVTGGNSTATPPSSTATPPSSAATPPSTTGTTSAPPPQDSRASSLAVAGLSSTFSIITLALWF